MRALFFVSGGIGHFHPLVPVARGLAERGHVVAFATRPSFCPTVSRAGFAALPIENDERDAEALARLERIAAAEEGLDRLAAIIGALLDRAVAAGPELVACARAWSADVIVREKTRCCAAGSVLAWAAWLAAERLGRPIVALDLGTWPTGLLRAVAGHRFEAARAAMGLPADPDLATLDPWLNIAGGPPAWFPPGQRPPSTRLFQPPDYDGSPASPPDWLEALPARPSVYVTLGTVYNRTPGVFPMIFEALAGADVNVMATIGPDVPPEDLGRLPGNVRVAPYIPQSILLPRCEAVIAHGGYSSVMGALRRGRPLVLLPLASPDNAVNASRVAALGAGIVIGEAERSAAVIHEATRAVLADGPHRRAARTAAAAMADLPPIEQAAALIEPLAAGLRPPGRLP